MNSMPIAGTRVWWTRSDGTVRTGTVKGRANRTHAYVLVPRRWTEQDFKTGQLIIVEGTTTLSVPITSLNDSARIEIGGAK